MMTSAFAQIFNDENGNGESWLRKAVDSLDNYAQNSLSEIQANMSMDGVIDNVAVGLMVVPGGGAASVGEEELISLYRAVDADEYTQIGKTGTFQIGANSLGGKFFAENLVDAQRWGNAMNGVGNSFFVQADIPVSVANQMMRWERLDSIGPARYGTLDQLYGVNIKLLGQ